MPKTFYVHAATDVSGRPGTRTFHHGPFDKERAKIMARNMRPRYHRTWVSTNPRDERPPIKVGL